MGRPIVRPEAEKPGPGLADPGRGPPMVPPEIPPAPSLLLPSIPKTGGNNRVYYW